jgi:hypothetical protein
MRDDELERMLRGAAAGPGVPPRLEWIIAAGRAPGHPGELAGEDAAVAAFRAASRTRAVGVAARPAPARRLVARMAAVKIAAVVAVLAVGGVGVAAATGTIDPRSLLREAPAPTATMGPSAGRTGATTSPPGQTSAPATDTPSGSATTSAGPSAAGLADLCRDLVGLPPGQARKLLADPPHDALAERAGGVDEVAGYCATLLGTASGPPAPDKSKPSKSPKARPEPPSRPTPAQPHDQGHGPGRGAVAQDG